MRDDLEEITHVIRHHWDRRANTFDDENGHGLVSDEQRSAWLDLLSRLVGSAPQRVLDVGCGTGFLALRFAELGHTVTGIDLAPQMIERAQRKAEQASENIDFRVGNAAALDCADESYDWVVARHLIWLLPDPERAVAEWLRVLRPGGRLLLIEGKWAYNDALASSYERPVLRILARATDLASLILRRHGSYRRYRGIEAQLPFSGGPTAKRLVAFLEANALHDVMVEPLMDPGLWGETPRYPRYLVVGTRSSVAEPQPVKMPPSRPTP
jgi:ubiquinone/menaquinone biosynthesis C-methylase UbiE